MAVGCGLWAVGCGLWAVGCGLLWGSVGFGSVRFVSWGRQCVAQLHFRETPKKLPPSNALRHQKGHAQRNDAAQRTATGARRADLLATATAATAGKGCYFLVFVQLFEKYRTLIERNTALIEKVSPCSCSCWLPPLYCALRAVQLVSPVSLPRSLAA
eukprot:SAG31_NODE_111_length_24443_cov_231.743685_8_plen_157_part_00